jgi:hypothetical protein
MLAPNCPRSLRLARVMLHSNDPLTTHRRDGGLAKRYFAKPVTAITHSGLNKCYAWG